MISRTISKRTDDKIARHEVQMPSTRVQRVARQIQQELSRIIECQLKDPRVGMVTLTHVDVSPDLRVARVYFSRLGTGEERESAKAALTHAAGFLRRELGNAVTLRYLPELRFHVDDSYELNAKIAKLVAPRPDDPDDHQ